MKEKGLYRFLAVSGHNRKAFPEFARQGFDVCHIRYNAAPSRRGNRGLPQLTGSDRPGVVTYTATRWGQLLRSGRMPAGEPPLKSSDCYRFALTHPAVDVCLTGPRNRKQMREALDTLDLGPPEFPGKWNESGASGTIFAAGTGSKNQTHQANLGPARPVNPIPPLDPIIEPVPSPPPARGSSGRRPDRTTPHTISAVNMHPSFQTA